MFWVGGGGGGTRLCFGWVWAARVSNLAPLGQELAKTPEIIEILILPGDSRYF